MRIVAGTAGGIHLEIPRTDLRPTMDRVRGAIFSSLGDLVPGARVLDLFAGSGALGLEALSRGAAGATFVEDNEKCIGIIARNLEKSRLVGDVIRQDAFAYLDRTDADAPYDLILADPPYRKRPDDRDFATELLASAGLSRRLAPDGLLVLERSPDSRAEVPPEWECVRKRKYGASEVLFLRRQPPTQ